MNIGKIKKLTNLQTQVFVLRSSQKCTKLSILQLTGIVYLLKQFKDESCIFLEVIEEKFQDNQKNPRNFFLNYAICEPRKISQGEILRILKDHLRMYIK